MNRLLRREDSALLVVDIQPSFLNAIWEKDRVLKRSQFLVEMAALLDVPVVASEQYPSRMGGTEPGLATALSTCNAPTLGKMAFGCLGDDNLAKVIQGLDKPQVVLVGIETHICITQTCLQLLDSGVQPIVAVDAVSARSQEMHKIGMERLRQAGVVPAHTESIAYEWMGSADHPQFRDALKIVKAAFTVE